jgi:hypothetical protein
VTLGYTGAAREQEREVAGTKRGATDDILIAVIRDEIEVVCVSTSTLTF